MPSRSSSYRNLSEITVREKEGEEITISRLFSKPKQRLSRFLVRSASRYLVVSASETAHLVKVDYLTLECPVFSEPVSMRETLSQGAGYGTKEEVHP
jgi:hypothetical protein